jgi:hypothetical protein
MILSDDDMRIIQDNFQMAMKVNDQVIIKKLSNKLQSLMKVEYDYKEFTDRTFIKKVIEDFNHYTGKTSN